MLSITSFTYLLLLILFTVCYFTEWTGEETATATTVAEQSTAEKKPEERADDKKAEEVEKDGASKTATEPYTPTSTTYSTSTETVPSAATDKPAGVQLAAAIKLDDV